jgi:hypothetical protein
VRLKNGPVWATGTLNALQLSFPPAGYRLPLASARQQGFTLDLNNNCDLEILSVTRNAEPKTESFTLFLEQLGPTIYPLICFDGIQPAGNYTDDTQTTGYAGLSGSDDQSAQRLTRDVSRSTSPVSQPCLQILGKKSFKCIYKECGNRFTRITDLKRHHLDIHERCVSFYCRFAGCRRAVRGFSRKDKRDDHQRRVHC